MTFDPRVANAIRHPKIARTLAREAGAHPSLADHQTLGLATAAELAAHEESPHGGDASGPHSHEEYATTAALDQVAAAADLAMATAEAKVDDADPRLTDARTPTAHSHVEGDLPAELVNSTELDSTIDTAVDAHLTADHAGLATDAELAAVAAAKADTSHSHVDADLPAGIARDSEVTAAINAHLAAAPHEEPGAGAEAFPVGSVFLTVVATSPATLLGYGTWSAIAAGRMLVGRDGSDAAFDTAEETGGAKTHTHAAHSGVISHSHPITDPGHTHAQQRFPTATGGSTGFTVDTSMSGTLAAANDTGSKVTGISVNAPAGAVSELTHDSPSHLPPYFVVYAWKRTA